jgi:CheY-like chemotaxis protein
MQVTLRQPLAAAFPLLGEEGYHESIDRPAMSRSFGILIVDDDASAGLALSGTLREHGFTVWLATSGEEAVHVYARRRSGIDLVLLDVYMPGLDGVATLQALRSADAGVRCCLMSAYRQSFDEEELAKLGVSRFFAKPFQTVELVQDLWLLVANAAEPETAGAPIALQADPAEPPGTERRVALRYLCRLGGSFQPVGHFLKGERWFGKLRDLAVAGTRVILDRRFEVGTLLMLEFPGSAGKPERRLLARVVRVVQEADDRWALGCVFISRLTEEELRRLLTEQANRAKEQEPGDPS